MAIALPIARVLVVDDDDASREVMSEVLRDEGYTVATAASLDAAMLLLASGDGSAGFRPNLLLLDFRLGDTTGLALAQAYRRLPPPHAPIVVVSGLTGGWEGLEEIRAVDVIEKPFELDDLLVRVARAMRAG